MNLNLSAYRMKILHLPALVLLVLAIALPSDAGFFKSIGKAFETAGKGIAGIAKTVAKPFCKVTDTIEKHAHAIYMCLTAVRI